MTRPPAPLPAERARTMAELGGRATLLPSGADPTDPTCAMRITPLLHQVHGDGTVGLLLPDDHDLVAAAWQAPRGELSAMLELTDLAPVALREPVRGLLWLTGWLRALPAEQARAAAVRMCEQRADPRLLDVGHGATVVELATASMVLADAEGTTSVGVEEFAVARPDPFCHHETQWLRHLELQHTDVVGLLSRHVPRDLRGGHVRPLGIDRYGLRLRVEAEHTDHDVRMAFQRPISTPGELSVELRRLVGCPFLAGRLAG